MALHCQRLLNGVMINYLDLNVSKTKEMIIDFTLNAGHSVSVIQGEGARVADPSIYLGLIVN